MARRWWRHRVIRAEVNPLRRAMSNLATYGHGAVYEASDATRVVIFRTSAGLSVDATVALACDVEASHLVPDFEEDPSDDPREEDCDRARRVVPRCTWY